MGNSTGLRIEKIVLRAITVLQAIGAGALTAMMFLIATDVMLRYLFNRPIVGAYDLTEFMMAITVSFGMAYCAIKKEHVAVNLFVERLPAPIRLVIDTITGFLSICLCAIITWQCFVDMNIQYNSNVTSSVLLVPIYPFVGLVGIGIAALTLAVILNFFKIMVGGSNQ